MIDHYFQRFAYSKPIIEESVSRHLGMIIVIPAYKEESLIPTFNSLLNANKSKKDLELIVVFNASEKDKEAAQINIKAKEELENHIISISKKLWFKVHIIVNHVLPVKHAGVGLARKIGMDEALFRLSKTSLENGIIICADADAIYANNFITAVESHFDKNPDTSACSIPFEHPLEGEQFEQEVYDGILFYELHLRYYKQGLTYAGLPFSFHTVGSSMAVRAIDYLRQGGMNKRKAGEDFYFLQKFIKLGNFTELNHTTVYPSPRPSDRVPFGTGRAILEMQTEKRAIDESYNVEVFEFLKNTFKDVAQWYKLDQSLPAHLIDFVGQDEWDQKIHEIRANSTSSERFTKRFFHWFDAFKTLQFVHYLRDKHFPNSKLIKDYPKLLERMGIENIGGSPAQLIDQARKIDRKT